MTPVLQSCSKVCRPLCPRPMTGLPRPHPHPTCTSSMRPTTGCRHRSRPFTPCIRRGPHIVVTRERPRSSRHCPSDKVRIGTRAINSGPLRHSYLQHDFRFAVSCGMLPSACRTDECCAVFTVLSNIAQLLSASEVAIATATCPVDGCERYRVCYSVSTASIANQKPDE